jgi:colanic acid biosynthesis glycosyl transferase WcaI
MAGKIVLLISQVFYPDEVAIANLFTNLCSELVKTGDIGINVWCGQPSYTNLKRQPHHREYNGVSIYYLLSTNFPKDIVIGRFLNYFTFSLSVILKLLFSKEKYLVITHTTPPFLAIIISLLCRVKKRPVLYIIMDVFPDGLIRLKKVSPRNPLIILWQKMHLIAIKKCQKIIVIGRDMKDWLMRIYPDGTDKVDYIPMWQDGEKIKPIPFNENPFVLKHNLQNSFIVQYSGNMGLWNEMETFGQAVNSKPENVKFIFIGGGMRRNELLDSFDVPCPENVLLLPFLPNESFAFSVSACHVALVSFRKNAEGMAVPSKIIGIMAAGIPVIALVPRNSEIAYIVDEEKCGIVVEPGDIEGLLNAISTLKSDEKLRSELGKNGRYAFEKKYTLKTVAKEYLTLIKALDNY